jgi:hypothetical protein
MNKKTFLTAALIAATMTGVNAQVGINNQVPMATLDVTAQKTDGTTAEGMIAPRLSGDQLKAADAQYATAQTGTIVYANAAVTTASTKTAKVTKSGYYYFDGTVWQPIGAASQWFYMPAAVLPTQTSDPAYNGTQFSVDLYGIYSQQFGLTNNALSVKALSATTLPIMAANQLEFFVTYFDNSVFQNVAVSDAGTLTYRVISGAIPTDATFMNIVFKVK